jgi:hypothetical protein
MRVYSSAGGESPRTHAWRLRAHPNPWDVQLAFDNCPITRWMTAQPARPGDFVEVDFVQPLEAAAVVVELAPDQANAGMRIDGEVQPGVWKTLADKPELVSSDAIVNARAAAVDDLKRFGITHLAIGNEDFIAQELYRNQEAWRISLVGEAGGARLYKLN